jgi:serine/threonine-protein kinase
MLNNRYRLDQQQGSGGMAVIYKATDIALGRIVAIKILRPSLTNDGSFLTRFRQEARNVANLSHPNIVTVHDVGQDGNTHFIVMEYIDGQDLKKIVRAEAPLSVERSLDLSIQFCAGIGYAHRAGLVHADVKPQNILVTAAAKVKVTDFGIAQALAMTQPQERQKVVWGSPHYFSPEQAQGEYPTPASDVYSIGVVLFEMLTGRLPFMASDQQELAMAHIRDTPPRISELNPQVPTSLDRIVQKVLSKEPSARYRTADQLGRILIAYKEQGREPTAGVSAPSPPGAPAESEASTNRNPSIPAPYAPPLSIPSSSDSTVARPSAAQHGPAAQTMRPEQRGAYDRGYSPSAPAPYQASLEDPNYYPSDSQSIDSQYDYDAYDYVEELPFDWVSVVLGFIALLAVCGVVFLWIVVINAYFG